MTKTKDSAVLTDGALQMVPLTDIEVSTTNEMFRDESDFSQGALQELIDSIVINGLVSPILLRPSTKANKFILVAGERRYRACKFIAASFKDRSTIPAYIRSLTDEQALDLQLTENVERKDIHPMREARAYKFLQDNRGWTTAELAARFGKGETYVLQRLRLVTLIKEAADDFIKGTMSLTQALVIARLEPADQKKVVERCKDEVIAGVGVRKKFYESVAQLEEFIADEITHDLSKASFDIKDADLVPKAGSCVTCQKRSGAQNKLFADVEDKDKCFDSACFFLKRTAGTFIKVKKLVEEKPDTVFAKQHSYGDDEKLDAKVYNYLKDEKVKILESGDWSSNTWSGSSYNKKVSAFMVSGPEVGRFKTIYLKGDAKQSKSSTAKKAESTELSAEDKKEAIARIKERTKRAAELDAEKIYARVIEALTKDTKWNKPEEPYELETVALIGMVLREAADFKVGDQMDKKLGFKSYKSVDMLKEYKRLTVGDLAYMARVIALERFGSSVNVGSEQSMLICELAQNAYSVPVDQFNKEQAEIREKREAKAKERIAELSAKPKKEEKKRPGLSAILEKKSKAS